MSLTGGNLPLWVLVAVTADVAAHPGSLGSTHSSGSPCSPCSPLTQQPKAAPWHLWRGAPQTTFRSGHISTLTYPLLNPSCPVSPQPRMDHFVVKKQAVLFSGVLPCCVTDGWVFQGNSSTWRQGADLFASWPGLVGAKLSVPGGGGEVPSSHHGHLFPTFSSSWDSPIFGKDLGRET